MTTLTLKEKLERKILNKFNDRCKNKISQINFKELILEYGGCCIDIGEENAKPLLI